LAKFGIARTSAHNLQLEISIRLFYGIYFALFEVPNYAIELCRIVYICTYAIYADCIYSPYSI